MKQGLEPSQNKPEDGTEPRKVLEARQYSVIEALRALNAKEEGVTSLADLYIGAIHTLTDSENPARFTASAHCLRELIEKLPPAFNIAIPHHSENLGEKVNILQDVWEGACRNSTCYSHDGWEGDVDRHLEKFLDRTGDFFKWKDEHRLSRTRRAVEVIRATDPAKTPMPNELEKLEAKKWITYHNYFNGISHHQEKPTYDEFNSWMECFELFLLDRLRPRTFDDQDEIDQLVT